MYCKLFASLYQGTLRGRSDEILVFTNLLAHTSACGTVDKHFRAIAEETGLSIDRVKQAILVLEAPDEESRSPDEDGARLVRLDEHRVWGWRVVNHGKYRAYRNEEDRAEKNREAQTRFREKKKQGATGESNGRVMERNGSNGRVMERNGNNTSKPIHIQKQKQDAETDVLLEKEPKERERAGEGEAVDPAKVPTTPTSKRLALIFHRRLTTPWSPSEIQAYKRIHPQIAEDDLAALEAYYAAHWPPDRDDNILRHDLKTVLNNYGGEVDRAHNWALHPPKAASPVPDAPKSFAQQDRDARREERHGPEALKIKFL